ncbi:hypothetical protein GGF50DRAFT_121397 [Schizophyllum commune]
MSAPAELLSHDSPSPLLCSRRTFLATKFTLDKCYSSRARQHVALSDAALHAFKARSHLLGQLAYRIRVAVVGSVGLKNAKSTSTVLRSAPLPLGDRCDSSSSSTGGDESHASSGAERRCVRLSARALPTAKSLQIDAKCAEVRAPRSR